MSLFSVKTRFLVSVGANILRAIISFITGLLVARGLTPAGYGDLAYLLGTFVAVKALLDMGGSSAFYTFISQQTRGRNYYVLYYGWLLMQFTATLLMVAVLLPQDVLDRIWLGSTREVILIALLASFLQQQVWTIITQLGESTRQTIKVQALGLAVIGTHSLVVVVLYFGGWLSIIAVLLAIIVEYTLAAIVSTRLLFSEVKEPVTENHADMREVINAYWVFCRPLILLAVVSFLYEFADRWMLQKYGGSIQQGFYQISSQLAAVCLLATTSILNILWKEISEANARQNKPRVAFLYAKVNRGLLMLGAVVSCFMIPWAEQIVLFLLGGAYQESWLIFAIMLIYPIHQSMGQVNATMFFACGQTKIYTVVSIFGQVISIPVTYLLVASNPDVMLAGLGLGALGLAVKMVGMNIFLVNIQGWMIARHNGWRYEWLYQVVGIGGVLVLGYLVKSLVCYFIPDAMLTGEQASFIFAFIISGILYLVGVAVFIWFYPAVAGIDKTELKTFVARLSPARP